MHPGLEAPLLSHSMRRRMAEVTLGLEEQQPSEQRPGWHSILSYLKSDINRGDVLIFSFFLAALLSGGFGVWCMHRMFALNNIASSVNFLVVGDWGGQVTANQSAVADAMAQIAQKEGVEFIISTGNNFAGGGLRSAEDVTFSHSFSQVYSAPALNVPWYVVLGPCDYGWGAPCHPQEQNCTFSPIHQLGARVVARDARWRCQRSFQVALEGAGAHLFFLDTSPFHGAYRGEAWAAFEGGLAEQSWKAQQAELEAALARSTAKWKLVVGHHPIRSSVGDPAEAELVDRLEPMLEAHGVQAYIAGAHNLQHLKRSCSSLHHLISGAGAGVKSSSPTPFLLQPSAEAFYSEAASHLDANTSQKHDMHVGGNQPCPRPLGRQATAPGGKANMHAAIGARGEMLGSESDSGRTTERGVGEKSVAEPYPMGLAFHAQGPGFMAAQVGEGGLRVAFYGIASSGGPQLLYSAVIPQHDAGPSDVGDSRARGWLRRVESALGRAGSPFRTVLKGFFK